MGPFCIGESLSGAKLNGMRAAEIALSQFSDLLASLSHALTRLEERVNKLENPPRQRTTLRLPKEHRNGKEEG